MTTVARIEQELAEAKAKEQKAETALQKFEDGDSGKRLKELEKKELDDEVLSEREERVLARLRLDKKQLEADKRERTQQVEKLQRDLTEALKTQTESERALKRPRIDRTASICQKLIPKFETIPTQADQLEPFINAQLLCKLPASKHEEEQYPELLELIYTNEDDSYSDLASHISVALSRQFNDNVSDIESEDDLHHVIDCLIKDTLRLFSRNAVPGSLDLLIRRNTVDRGWTTTTIGTCRPDFLVHHKNVLVLKGEEKATPNSFHEALGDLTDKFDKLDPLFFGDQQFLICYAVAGWKIGFYAIDGTPEAASKPSRLITLSPQFDLRKVADRITVISVTINILRILVTIGPYLPNDVIPLYLPIQQDSGSTITFYDDSVVKELSFKDLPYVDGSLSERIAFLREMYDHAKGCLNLVQLKKRPIKGRSTYSLIMTTRGIRRLPCNETELRSMVRSLLAGLDCLHSGNYVHRDIREPNVLFVPENPAGSKYVLIDFEHGGKANEEMDERLSGWDHRTLSNNQYTTLSDIYQLGKLIERLMVRFQMSISDSGKTFVKKLKEKKMNVTRALQHTWITDANFP